MRHDSAALNKLRASALSLALADRILETLALMPPHHRFMKRLEMLFSWSSCALMISQGESLESRLA